MQQIVLSLAEIQRVVHFAGFVVVDLSAVHLHVI